MIAAILFFVVGEGGTRSESVPLRTLWQGIHDILLAGTLTVGIVTFF